MEYMKDIDDQMLERMAKACPDYIETTVVDGVERYQLTEKGQNAGENFNIYELALERERAQATN